MTPNHAENGPRAARPVTTASAAGPLGPDSLTWKYFGDLRTGMLGVWIGAIQNMYPGLGAGVEGHSILLREPLQRVARSVYPIMGVVYDGERAPKTGEQVKGFHKTIKGVDADGRRYHALNPETDFSVRIFSSGSLLRLRRRASSSGTLGASMNTDR